MGRLMRWGPIVLAALGAWPATGHAASSACEATQRGFDAVYCQMAKLQQADGELNARYAELRAKLAAPRREGLQADQRAWLQRRDRNCTRREGGRLFADLACAVTTTAARAEFLAGLYRDCVGTPCSDLDFYNTQEGEKTDRGPKLASYPAISRYSGPDAGYVAVYTRDDRNVLYPVGNGIFVAGFIRLRGHYEGRIFQPAGYGSADISADPDFKALTDALFPGHSGGTWAGGDTGGFVMR